MSMRTGTGTRGMAAVIAAVAVLVTALFTAPAAQAQAGRAYVAMGDSFPANPAIPEQLDGFFRGYCSQRDDAYPDLVGRDYFGGDYVNLACNGNSLSGGAGPSLVSKMNAAHARGEIGPATRLVTITAGAAEGWNPATPRGRDFGIIDGADHVTPQRWVERMGPVIGRINQLAPNARIMFVSYPEIGDGNGNLCLATFSGGSAHLPVPVPLNVERFIDTVNSTAAAHQHLGYEYVDTDRPGTGTCAPVGNQWVRSVFDIPGAGDGLRMPFHPTALGERAVADIVMSRL
ncbi:SGNH/GDSL hydrolase family protein [Corynebacterium halotolerans]|uniref:SGNH hydrolase-type esterase domain-containing protein n=1 Tax=Corynebacterium halotolerans YIM 70093 = DSM 44683 TaxID=1121362 RepID=M1NQ10_9CORY|nr:SGNH/GDSL hydrolase family protein [Corynebacterium halotolerans]AGF73468.1 hypothetical protein A605_12360 [Corynebacterium halotolerans YIM 70093 = DSM 44683]